MGRLAKITKRVLRGQTAYVMNIPKAIAEALGEPREVLISIETRDGKQVIVLEPVQHHSNPPSHGPHSKTPS